MKTFVKHLLLMCLYMHSADGLQCKICNGYTPCDETPQNCSFGTETFCFSRLITQSYDLGNYTYHRIEKGCASRRMCTSSGSQVVSYNTGYMYALTNTTCCDTDNCNAADPDFSASPPAGSLQCYGCDGDECTANLTCSEQETCFQSLPRQYGQTHGCISENVCTDSSLAPLNNVSCCNTSHCNVQEMGLQCMGCTDYSCSSERSVFCSKDASLCYSYGYFIDLPDTNQLLFQKGCARPSPLCPSTGNMVVSYHQDSTSFAINISCCDTDGCNVAKQSTMIAAGSLQCYSCNYNRSECTANLTCNELEVCAMTPGNNSRQVYGCVSKNLCNNITMSQIFLGYDEEISCCDTHLCNNPFKTGEDDTGNNTGLLLSLSVPLFILGLFTHTF